MFHSVFDLSAIYPNVAERAFGHGFKRQPISPPVQQMAQDPEPVLGSGGSESWN
jgi:hypothetical protein